MQILEEKEAQKFAESVGVPLAFINPSAILGPIMSPKAAGFSINIIKVTICTFFTRSMHSIRDNARYNLKVRQTQI